MTRALKTLEAHLKVDESLCRGKPMAASRKAQVHPAFGLGPECFIIDCQIGL